MDGVVGTLKNRIFRDVMSQKCFIQNAKEFSKYANTVVNGITSVYLPQNDLLTKPGDIGEAPKIPETLSIHKVVQGFNEDGINYLSFTIYPTAMSRSLHSIIKRKMILIFVAMNC